MATKPLFSENAQTILVHLQANTGVDETAQMIADATGLPVKTVNGCVTAALQRKGYAVREEVEGFDKKVIKLTAEGVAADPYAEVEVESKKKAADDAE